MTLTFEGSSGHLPVSTDESVIVWADVTVAIDTINNYVVRGDSTEHRIEITGTVTEIGGQGASINNAELILSDKQNCDTTSDIKCITIDSLIWNGPTYTILATAPSWIEPGLIQLNVKASENSTEYLRSGNAWTNSISVRIDLGATI